MPSKRPLLTKVLLFVVSIVVLFLGLTLVADWFYKSGWLMENKSAQYVRRRMDYAFYYAFMDNTFGYRDYVFSGAPDLSVWRPFRIIPDMELPEAWDGTSEFNTVFGEVYEWDPTNDILSVIISLPSPNRLYLHLTDDVKIIIPQFDEIGQPVPSPIVDLNYVTDYSLPGYFSHYTTFEDAYELVSNFKSREELTAFIANTFSGLDPALQFKTSGSYTWESAFCARDNIQVSFGKELNIKGLETLETVVPKLVIVNQAGCSTEFTGEQTELPLPLAPLPGLSDRDSWLELWNTYSTSEVTNEN